MNPEQNFSIYNLMFLINLGAKGETDDAFMILDLVFSGLILLS
jgi:hypothetical protein